MPDDELFTLALARDGPRHPDVLKTQLKSGRAAGSNGVHWSRTLRGNGYNSATSAKLLRTRLSIHNLTMLSALECGVKRSCSSSI